jgi:hypothetical protein
VFYSIFYSDRYILIKIWFQSNTIYIYIYIYIYIRMFAHHNYMFRLHQRGRNQAVQDCEKVIIDIKFWASTLPYIRSY